MFYLRLISTVRKMISVSLIVVCYPFVLTNGTFIQLLSRMRTSSSRSGSVISSCWIWGTFLEEHHRSWFLLEHIQHFKKERFILLTNSSITPTNYETQNFLLMAHFTINFVAVIVLRQNKMTLLTYWEVEWPQNKLLCSWNYQSHHLL